MTVSRWKVMAGVLGVSLGGLAAIAGQAPKVGDTRKAELPALPELPADKTKPGAPPVDVAPPMIPSLPAATPAKPAALPILPITDEPPVADAKKPTLLPLVPAGGVAIPSTPIIPVAGTNQLPPLPSGGPPSPTLPGSIDAGAKQLPLPADKPPMAATNILPVTKGSDLPPEFKPTDPPPANLGPATPSTITPPAPTLEPAARTAAVTTPTAAATATASTAKYRILLRVGEGEPQFEVRNGDDLMMKVVCEKVDISSPAQKGGTPTQQVTASGKVRFAGFGSEGTCDQLSFVAGTGELMLAGNVTIQVKDKLGRIDSELKSDKVKYKLDASAMPGVMKP